MKWTSFFCSIILSSLFSGCASLQSMLHREKIHKSWEGDPPTELAIKKILAENKDARIVVVLGCSATFSDDYFRHFGVDRAQWTKNCVSMKQAETESSLLKKFGDNKRFKLVDRGALDKVFDELALSAKPEISDDTRLQIGKLTSATHILLVQFTRSEVGEDTQDNFAEKLIGVENGELLSSLIFMRAFREN